AQQTGDDVQQGRLATAGRAEQGVRSALLPDMVHLADGVVLRAFRMATVAVSQILQTNFSHQRPPPIRRSGACTRCPCSSKTNSLCVGTYTRIGSSTP